MLITAGVFIVLLSGVRTLGPLDGLIIPGAFLVWTLVWGDNMTGSSIEHITLLGTCLIINGMAGFLLGGLAGYIRTRCARTTG